MPTSESHFDEETAARREGRSNLFCLSGEVDGHYCSFPLGEGEHLVGYARSAEVRLQQRGVSRRHAAVEIMGDTLVVRDLGSKNGTLVNGEPIADGRALAVGDEVRFGTVRFVVGRVETEDAELAISLVAAADPSTANLRPDETTLLSQMAPAAADLEWVEAFWSRLTADRPGDLEAALDFLVRAVAARSGAWIEWPRPGDGATLLAAVGEMGPLPAEPTLRRRCARCGDVEFLVGAEQTTVALRTPAQELFALVLWGAGQRQAELMPLFRLAIRLAERFRPESLAAPSSLAASSNFATPDELRWPEGIVVGQSPAMKAFYQEMRPLLRTDLPVLISGETGVGKEHLAMALHLSSRRCEEPFVAINCAAIPAELLEAELFGIGRGVATGVQPRLGKFAEADGGTLFLDEIGEMPAPLQAKLLRALQNQEIQPVGAALRKVDLRIVAATNIRPSDLVESGGFRRDLYYRLAGYVLEVPPLRDRIEDLPLLITHFLRRFGTESHKTIRGLTVKALRLMSRHAWPGNVRELEHEVRRLAHSCPDGRAVDSAMLSRHIGQSRDLEPLAPGAEEIDFESTSLEHYLEATEQRVIAAALTQTSGNQSQAAKLLAVSRNGLAKRLQRLAIDPRDFTDPE